MMTESKFATAADVLAYMFAGNATFTFRSLKTGAHFTYKIQKNDKANNFFVKVLTGPDNVSDYTYIGMIVDGQFKTTAKSKMRRGSAPVDVITWALTNFNQNGKEMPAQMEVWHTGRCGRCGRPLTVPASVASGIGPDCAAQMGHGQVVLPLADQGLHFDAKGFLPENKTVIVKRTFSSAKADMKAAGGRAVAEAMYAPAKKTVDQELDELVKARVADYRNAAPENYYQDGMLDEEEAFAVAYNKFRKEMEQDDRYLGSKFGELEAQQEAEAYRRMQ